MEVFNELFYFVCNDETFPIELAKQQCKIYLPISISCLAVMHVYRRSTNKRHELKIIDGNICFDNHKI